MTAVRVAGALLLAFLATTTPATPAIAASIPGAQPDKGLVVFYREKKAKGGALRFQISDGAGVSLGNLSNGSTFHVYLEPGQHTFKVSAPSLDGSDSVTVTLDGGQTVFYQGEIKWGWPTGRPKFNQVTEAVAKPAISKL